MGRSVGSIMVYRPGLPKLTSRLHLAQVLRSDGACLKSLGRFAVDLGTGGKGVGRGEETEFLLRAKAAGAKGAYVGEALCYHAFDRNRLTLVALWHYGIVCGRSHNAIADTTASR